MRYKVIRIYEIEALHPQDAMARADVHDLVYQKAVLLEDSGSWSKSATDQIRGKGRR